MCETISVAVLDDEVESPVSDMMVAFVVSDVVVSLESSVRAAKLSPKPENGDARGSIGVERYVLRANVACEGYTDSELISVFTIVLGEGIDGTASGCVFTSSFEVDANFDSKTAIRFR